MFIKIINNIKNTLRLLTDIVPSSEGVGVGSTKTSLLRCGSVFFTKLHIARIILMILIDPSFLRVTIRFKVASHADARSICIDKQETLI
jgi:hypothetical protein